MENLLKGCIIYADKRKCATAEEKGKLYTLNNNNGFKITKVKIDNCVFRDETKKCDWMFLVGDKFIVLVELKGGKIRESLPQLLITYQLLKDKIKNERIFARVCTGKNNHVPKIKDNTIYKELQRVTNKNVKIGKNLIDNF